MESDDRQTVDDLDQQIQTLEARYAELEAQQVNLVREVERIYRRLMVEFEQRWTPLRKTEQ
ncbi:MAG: hypothetical protein JW892_16270 [Anaerolineae bacterium]|nr:hypothetical protein [Anaerolineae bacterium]